MRRVIAVIKPISIQEKTKAPPGIVIYVKYVWHPRW